MARIDLSDFEWNVIRLFSPGIWWIGLTMNRSGSEVQILQTYSLGVRPLSVLRRRAKLYALRKSARWLRSCSWLSCAAHSHLLAALVKGRCAKPPPRPRKSPCR
jgi:hypothetical protein